MRHPRRESSVAMDSSPWQHSCSSIGATCHLRVRCAKMGQSMENQSEFVGSVPNEFPVLAPHPSGPNNGFARNRSLGERPDRKEWVRIGTTHLRVAQIEATIANFVGTMNALGAAIKVERDRTGICDLTHFAYSTLARSMIQRRDNLKHSVDELKRQLCDARARIE